MSTNTPLKTTTTEKSAMTGKQDAVRAISKWLTRDDDQGDELDRCCACHSLGVLGDHNSVATLVNHLRDEDIDVCIDAAEALGQIGDVRAVAPLLESLHNDPDGDVKTVVVKVLARLGGEQAIKQLLEYAISPPEDEEWDDEEAWDSNWDIQIEAVKALGQLHVAEAVTPLNTLVDDNECQVDKSHLFNALAHIGGTGEQALIQRLQEDTPRERRRAAHALGLSCSAIGARALGRALQDPEPEVRIAAADALASGRHDRYLDALILLLRDPSDEVRETALKAVNKLTTSSAPSNTTTIDALEVELKKLLPLLNDNSPQVRAAVLKTLRSRLGKGSDGNIKSRIQELLEDPNSIVAAAACPLAVILDNPQTEKTLLSLAVNPQGDSALRQQAILALGQRGNASEEVLMTLTKVLNTEDAVILFAALQALLALHTQGVATNNESNNENDIDETLPAPLEIILDALRGEVISPVASEPTRIKPKPQAEELTIDETNTSEELDDVAETQVTETQVAEKSVSPISTLDSIAMANAELAQQLEENKALNPDETPELSAEEMETFQPYYDILKQQKHNRKKFTRKKTVNVGNEVRRLSARVLGECSQPDVVKALTQTIHDENSEVQHEAINALARMTPDTPGITEILGPLTSFLHLGNVDLRVVSARTLGALGNFDILPSLVECLEDENQLVRNQAVFAVGQLLKTHMNHASSTTEPLAVTSKRAQKEATLSEETVEHALRSLVNCLGDTNVGVRKATALTLSELGALLFTRESPMKPSNELHKEIIEHLITAGFVGEGLQARDMGLALRSLDPAMASDRLIPLLDNLPSSHERRFAMEMLEEVFRPSA